MNDLRICLRDPIPEIFDAARFLDAAVSAHLQNEHQLAKELIHLANNPAIWDWTESVWGKNSPYVVFRGTNAQFPLLPKERRVKVRMPTNAEKLVIQQRDGYHCRFCGIPVIRREVRQRMQMLYSDVLPWGRSNTSQHAAFQAMWAQYDHVVPHARGGDNSIQNLVLACAACNFGRMNSLVDEIGLHDPRTRMMPQTTWDGLERFQ